MGQRHQAFLIARIIPHGQTEARYRCIGAFHSQWCYGTLPLKATRRFLTLIKQPCNAEIVRYEISQIHGKYGRRGDKEPKIVDIPCPYSLFLLGSAWNVDLDPSNYYAAFGNFLNNALPAGMRSFGGRKSQSIQLVV